MTTRKWSGKKVINDSRDLKVEKIYDRENEHEEGDEEACEKAKRSRWLSNGIARNKMRSR